MIIIAAVLAFAFGVLVGGLVTIRRIAQIVAAMDPRERLTFARKVNKIADLRTLT